MPASTAIRLPRQRAEALAERIGHRFKDPAPLHQALVHRSYLNENPDEAVESNERLEFLGDAVLGSVISRYLFDQYPNAAEGWLTEVRSRLVRNETLADLASKLDIGPYLILGKGVEAQAGRERPAILGRAVEALIGAVYVDGGMGAARRVILRTLTEELRAIAVGGLERDPKSLLQQACQAQWQATPRYETVEQRGPAHDREFRVEVHLNGDVLGYGSGKSKQAAEKVAAERALQTLPPEIIP